MIKIAVDGMGSDNSPRSEVEGAIQAARDYGVHVILVGKESVLGPLLKEQDRGASVELKHASEAIAMD